jgi:hypothetical protein
MLHLLGEWEINGYSDSDFMAVVYDDVENSVKAIETGSTRYAGGRNMSDVVACTPEVVEKARVLLEQYYVAKYTEIEYNKIHCPDNVDIGVEVVLQEKHRSQVKETETCSKCNGTGQWVSPCNSSDIRECFTCNGTGLHKGKAVKNDGKIVYNVLQPGTVGTVVDCNAYGKFYAKGYNQPCRENRQCKVKLANGDVVSIPLKKLGLNRTPKSEECIRAIADLKSRVYHFAELTGKKFAWYTRNYAAEVCFGK